MGDVRDELSEAGKREIAEAVRILREDGVHIHRTYAKFQESLQSKPEEKPEEKTEEEAGEGGLPPVKDKPDIPKVEYGLWGKRRPK